MQVAVVRIAALNARAALARGVSAAQASIPVPTRPKPRLLELWHETNEAVGAYAAPLLLLGVIGFAAAPLLSSTLAVMAVPFTRMAIMQTVIHGSLRGMQWRGLSVLLIMAGIYTTAMFVGQIGIGVPLRAWGLNLNFADQRIATWAGVAQTLGMRSVNTLTNIPALPLKDELRVWHNWASDEWVQQPDVSHDQQTMVGYWQNVRDAANGSGTTMIEVQTRASKLSRPDLRLVFIGGVLLVFVAETLFAFRSLLVAKPAHQLWLSLKHFGTVAGHLWFLRLVVVGLKALFVFVPIIVVDYYAYLARDWGWFGSATQGVVLAICLAFIDAVISTFEAVYVARLYLTLVSEGDQTTLQSPHTTQAVQPQSGCP